MRTALLWIWFSSAYYRREKETSGRKIEFGLLFWDPSDVRRNGPVLSDVLDLFDRPVCQQIMLPSLFLCLPVCLPACAADDLSVYVWASLQVPAAGRHYCRMYSQVVMEWRALPLGTTCAAVAAGEEVWGRVAITGPVKSLIACSDSRAWHPSPF